VIYWEYLPIGDTKLLDLIKKLFCKKEIWIPISGQRSYHKKSESRNKWHQYLMDSHMENGQSFSIIATAIANKSI
jgi:hypothetical protein